MILFELDTFFVRIDFIYSLRLPVFYSASRDFNSARPENNNLGKFRKKFDPLLAVIRIHLQWHSVIANDSVFSSRLFVSDGMYQILLLFFTRDQLRVEFLSDLNYNFSDSHGRSNPLGSQSCSPKGISWWQIIEN